MVAILSSDSNACLFALTAETDQQRHMGDCVSYMWGCAEGGKWRGNAKAGQQRSSGQQPAQHVWHAEGQVQAASRTAGAQTREMEFRLPESNSI